MTFRIHRSAGTDGVVLAVELRDKGRSARGARCADPARVPVEEFDLDPQHVVEAPAALVDVVVAAAANPSTSGDWPIAPASSKSDTASSTMYMPANEVPHANTRRASMAGCAAAQPMTVR